MINFESLKPKLRFWLHEPLVHFLAAGFLVFLFFSWRGETVDPASRTITISAAQIEQLAGGWAETWNRPPTQVEIDGLIRDSIKEEIYNREAKRMGMDVDDPVIRRRLRSKMEFLESSEIENAVPDDATLQAWLDKHSQKYVEDVRYSFDQIYLKAQTGDAVSGRAKQILIALKKGADWQDMGDTISLPKFMENASKTEIARTFGDDFAASLGDQNSGRWIGPIASGFGVHLVRIRNVQASATPSLKQVRQQVENDWRSATLKDRMDKSYQTLLDGYTIKIAKP